MERFPAILARARHSWRPATAGAVTSAALLVTVLAGSHLFQATAEESPEPAVEQRVTRADSGTIGPWQQSGHTLSAPAALAKAAADPRGVLLVGDSTATRSRTAILAALPGRPVAWDLWNGRPTHGTVDAVIALVPRHLVPRSLIVMSGSNDVFEPEAFAAQVRRLREHVGPDQQIYWVSPGVGRPDHLDADRHNSVIMQQALRQEAAQQGQLHVIDWPGALAAMNEQTRATMVRDGVHPSPAGSSALAALIATALR